jgi:ADP-ribose pyrophosphatase
VAQPIENTFRYCPRCGSESLSVGEVPFRCAQCEYAFFFGPVTAVGGIIPDDRGRVLLIRRARNPGRGQFGLPGGFVDRGESGETALRREVQEELNLKITEFDFLLSLPNFYTYGEVTAPVVDLFFVCQFDPADAVQANADEVADWDWMESPARRPILRCGKGRGRTLTARGSILP